MYELLLGGIWGCGVSVTCSVIFNNRMRDALLSGLLGGLGWVVFLLVPASNSSQTVCYFLGALTAAFCAEIFAYRMKNPATIYLLPSLYPLVPGWGMFSTLHALVTGDMKNALTTGYATLMAAGAIALAIALASSFTRMISRSIRQIKHRNSRNTLPLLTALDSLLFSLFSAA